MDQEHEHFITLGMTHQPGIIGPLAIEGKLRAEIAARAGQAPAEVTSEIAPQDTEQVE